jgi:hypothetical protein
MGGGTQNADTTARVLDDREDVVGHAVSVVVVKKSHARIAWAWLGRKPAQVWRLRSGAGSMPCRLEISHTVEAATVMPRVASSPWTRR